MRMLPGSLLVAGFVLMTAHGAISQDKSSSIDIEKLRADMAVPDAPAFKILSVEPSNIMRPSNLREVGMTVSNFLLGGGVLPKAFAVELSPLLLLEQTSVGDYQKNPLWYRMRVSAGTKENSIGGTDLAFGIRFTALDKSDLRINTGFLKEIREPIRQINRLQRSVSSLRADTSHLQSDTSKASQVRAMIAQEPEAIAPNGEKLAATEAQIQAYRAMIKRSRDTAKAKDWNKQILEVGLAMAASSRDSLARNLVSSTYGLWITGGLPICGDKGQLLLGAKGLWGRNVTGEMSEGEGSFALRVYYGENTAKGLIEWDWSVRSDLHPAYTLGIGGELDVANGFWLDTSFGVAWIGSGTPRITSSFNIRVATPEPD